ASQLRTSIGGIMTLHTTAISALVPALLTGCFSSLASAAGALADASAPQVQIEQTACDYLEGWYSGDATRLGRALHPDLVKRYVDALPAGRQVVFTMSRDQMVEMTRLGGGTTTPAEGRNVSVRVLGISGDIAVAEASSSEYIEYLSLARCNGQWVIVNILWRFRSSTPHPR
ncbi:MAG: nuclear transport factor 2 family protein, partial [Acidobacteriota bacterium]